MTVLEATSRLVEFFALNDSFQLSKDFSKVVLVSDTDACQAAVVIALEELEKQRFVFKKDINGQEFWVLAKPLLAQNQDIQISLLTAIQVATTINKFIDKEEHKVNPMRITEQDIVNLALIKNSG